MDLSIIIISYNTSDITRTCIESVIDSLKDSNIKYEIIVVDNDSHDESQKMLLTLNNKYDEIIQLVLNKENMGFGKANNMAAARARGTHLLFLNSDTIILDRAIEKMYTYYSDHDEIHFLGPKLLNRDHSLQPSAAPFFTLPVVFAFIFLKGDKIGLTRSSPTKTKQVDWVSGACLLCKKAYFENTGGFDENIFMYMDEVDLLYRAKKQHFNTYFYADTSIVHLGAASSNPSYPIIQVYQGLLYFYQKHKGRAARAILKIMLKYKALISIWIGRIVRNKYLIETYEEAYKLV